MGWQSLRNGQVLDLRLGSRLTRIIDSLGQEAIYFLNTLAPLSVLRCLCVSIGPGWVMCRYDVASAVARRRIRAEGTAGFRDMCDTRCCTWLESHFAASFRPCLQRSASRQSLCRNRSHSRERCTALAYTVLIQRSLPPLTAEEATPHTKCKKRTYGDPDTQQRHAHTQAIATR